MTRNWACPRKAPRSRNASRSARAVTDSDFVATKPAMRNAELVHGDLSEYNLLWWDGRPWVIDCAQAVPFAHPRSDDWFRRDVGNIARYFARIGVDTDAGGRG